MEETYIGKMTIVTFYNSSDPEIYSNVAPQHGVEAHHTWQFILKALSLSLMAFFILVGNSLVILAIMLYRKLRRNISNLFIASLALADLTLGIAVVPFSLVLELLGYWVFGQVFCKLYLAVDIWLCTASIFHLSAISLDRFVAIAYPMKYRNLITRRRCRIICLALWILSFIISFPALVNWSRDLPRNNSMTETGAKILDNTYRTTVKMEFTQENITYNQTAPRSVSQEQCWLLSHNSTAFIIYSAMGSFFIPSFIMAGFYIKIFLLARSYMKQASKGRIKLSASEDGPSMRVHRGTRKTSSTVLYSTDASIRRTSDTGYYSLRSELKSSLDNESFPRRSLDMTYTRDRAQLDIPGIKKSGESPTQHRKYKKHSEGGNSFNRETRAAKTVAIIVGGFIACWSPFFICYVIQGVSDVDISDSMYQFFIWLGYANSLLNPCIYACFSNDFRHAFKRILKCQLKSQGARKPGLLRYIASLYIPSSSGVGANHTVVMTQKCYVSQMTDVDESA